MSKIYWIGLSCLLFTCDIYAQGIENLTYTFASPTINEAVIERPFESDELNAQTFYSINIPGLISGGEPGTPALPVKSLCLLIPPGKNVIDVEVTSCTPVELSGEYMVWPNQESFPITNPPDYSTPPNPAIYDSDTPYPSHLASLPRSQTMRGYHLCMVDIYPVQYIPQQHRIWYYPELNVSLVLEDAEQTPDEQSMPLRSKLSDQETIRSLVDNPEVLETYVIPTTPPASDGGFNVMDATSTALPTGQYDYVIIASTQLLTVCEQTTPNLQTLLDHRRSRGLTATLVAVEWIYENYDGTRPDGGSDNQTRIRNFIRDAYENWQTDYVLLAGDCDEGAEGTLDNTIPIRTCCVNGYCGDSDTYYACLDGTFDDNTNGIYGETGDGSGLDYLPDAAAEVYVGRAPVDSAEEVAHFVGKTMRYETETNNSALSKTVCVSEFDGNNFDMAFAIDTVLHDSNGSTQTNHGLSACEELNVDWVRGTYEKMWVAQRDIVPRVNEGIQLLLNVGHGGVSSVMQISTPDVFTNEFPFLAWFGMSCLAGDVANSSQDCIVESMVTAEHGPFAATANSRKAYFGAIEYIARYFFETALAHQNGFSEIGRAYALAVQQQPSAYQRYIGCLFADPAVLLNIYPVYLKADVEVITSGQTVFLELSDSNCSNDPELIETTNILAIVSSGDIEHVLMTETGTDTGIFTGSVLVTQGSVTPDCVMNVQHNDTITFSYDDAQGIDQSPCVVQEVVRCDLQSAIATVHVVSTDIVKNKAQISIETDKPTSGKFMYWTGSASPHEMVLSSFATNRVVWISLAPHTTTCFNAELHDQAGNITLTDERSIFANRLPEFPTSHVAYATCAGSELTFNASALREAGESLVYTCVSVLPQSAVFTTSGHFSWTPDVNQPSTNFTISITASDEYTTCTQMVEITVIGTGDNDYDGVSNCDEYFVYHSNPDNADSDGDGLSDGLEIEEGLSCIDVDSDHDGLTDVYERSTPELDPLDPDMDNDGVSDGIELLVMQSSIFSKDTDNDGLSDYDELIWATCPTNSDSDGDGLSDYEETGPSRLVCAEQQCLALTREGNVFEWGLCGQDKQYEPYEVSFLSNVVDISTFRGKYALCDDGSAWVWQVVNNNTVMEEPIQVMGLPLCRALGPSRLMRLAIDLNNSVWQWDGFTYVDGAWTAVGDPYRAESFDHFSSLFQGRYHYVALSDSGQAWTWGANPYGQLGRDGAVDTPAPIEGYDKYRAVASGGSYTLLLRVDGTVWGCGGNYSQALGFSGPQQSRLIHLSELSNILQIASYGNYCCAMDADGRLWVWGGYAPGMGDENIYPPVQVPVEGRVVKIALEHTYVIIATADGKVWSWGLGRNGELGLGSSLTSINNPTLISNIALHLNPATNDTDQDGLTDDQELFELHRNPNNPDEDGDGMPDGYEWVNGLDWSQNDSLDDADGDGLSNLLESLMGYAANTVDTDGDGILDGNEDFDQDGLSNLAELNEYESDCLQPDTDQDGLNDGEEVFTHHTNPLLSDTDGDNVSDKEELFTYYSDPLLLDTDGDALSDGYEIEKGLNLFSPDTDNDGLSDSLEGLIQFAAGSSFSLALGEGGTLNRWGLKYSYHDESIPSRPYYYDYSLLPTIVTGIASLVSLDIGLNHWVALDSDGTMFYSKFSHNTAASWLENFQSYAQQRGGIGIIHAASLYSWYYSIMLTASHLLHGDSYKGHSSMTMYLDGFYPAIDFAAGINFALALHEDGTVWCMGENIYGQAARQEHCYSTYPGQIQGLSDVVDIDMGQYHCLAVRNDGTVYAWGNNWYGQLGLPPDQIQRSAVITQIHGLNHVKAVSSKGNYNLALCEDGTLWGWGDNDYGQTGSGMACDYILTPAQIPIPGKVIAMAAGFYHSLALTSDGRLWAWGSNGMGQLGDGTQIASLIPVRVQNIHLAPTDPLNPDTDDDGMLDGWEYQYSLDGLQNDADLDADSDGLSNYAEYILNLDPQNTDTDGDGINDADEDADLDGMRNLWEILYGLNPLLNDADLDADGDGLSNFWEHYLGTNPQAIDTDNDGICDGDEDSDGDTYTDSYEIICGTDPLDPNDIPVETYTDSSTLSLTKDSYIQSANPVFCYGGVDNEITVSGGDHMGGYENMFIHIDVPGDILGKVVNNAKLELYLFSNGTASMTETIFVYKVTSPWDEGPNDPLYVSFNTQPTTESEPVCQATVSGSGKWIQIDITELFNDWSLNGNNFGLQLRMPQCPGIDNRKRCWSKEGAYPELRPKVQINGPDISLQLQSATDGKDSYIQSANPVFCYGGVDNEITVSGCDHMGGYQELLVQFNLPTLPAGKTVLHADLELYLFANNNSGVEERIYAHTITEAWDEGPNDPLYVSYNTMPTSESTPFSSTTVTGQGKWITLDITDAVIDWMELGETNHGVLLKMNHIGSDNRKRFYSKDNSNTSLRPKMNIWYE